MDVLIRRLDCTYQIPATIERAEEAQRRLDRVAKELLGNALEQRFAGWKVWVNQAQVSH
jgi:hypothetical protein